MDGVKEWRWLEFASVLFEYQRDFPLNRWIPIRWVSDVNLDIDKSGVVSRDPVEAVANSVMDYFATEIKLGHYPGDSK